MADLVLCSHSGKVYVSIDHFKPGRARERLGKEEKRILLEPRDLVMTLSQLQRIYAKEIAEVEASVDKRAHGG